jgi:pimeloyl-ACP methyl ester carboxylesterase
MYDSELPTVNEVMQRQNATRRKGADEPLALVLIPGFMGTASAWRFQIDAFGGSRPIAIPDEHYSFTSIRDMACHMVERLPPRFDLVGWSMGGYIAIELYPLVRERVRKLALIATSARPESAKALAGRAELLKSVESTGLRAAFMSLINSNLNDPARVATAFIDGILADTANLGEETLRNQLAALISRRDTRPSLGKVECEALIVVGQHDAVTPPECSRELASLLPRASLEIVEEAGHFAPWEKPQAVNGLLQAFLPGE